METRILGAETLNHLLVIHKPNGSDDFRWV